MKIRYSKMNIICAGFHFYSMNAFFADKSVFKLGSFSTPDFLLSPMPEFLSPSTRALDVPSDND
jgi:hypothetical protein